MTSTALIIRNKCLLQQLSKQTHLQGKGVIWKEQLRYTQLLALDSVLYTQIFLEDLVKHRNASSGFTDSLSQSVCGRT